jgi:hypothetical protein
MGRSVFQVRRDLLLSSMQVRLKGKLVSQADHDGWVRVIRGCKTVEDLQVVQRTIQEWKPEAKRPESRWGKIRLLSQD